MIITTICISVYAIAITIAFVKRRYDIYIWNRKISERDERIKYYRTRIDKLNEIIEQERKSHNKRDKNSKPNVLIQYHCDDDYKKLQNKIKDLHLLVDDKNRIIAELRTKLGLKGC